MNQERQLAAVSSKPAFYIRDDVHHMRVSLDGV